MKSNIKRVSILIAILIVLVLGISKLIITPSKVVMTTLDKVVNESTSAYGISKDDMDKIQSFYKSFVDINLPQPKLEYDKEVKLNNLINQNIYIKKHPRNEKGNYQTTVSFNYNEYSIKGEGYDIKNIYHGVIYFEIEKLGFNKWKVSQVKVINMSPASKGGQWSGELN